MTASGILASDSGENILLEDHYAHSGREKTMRMEIPYPSLVCVREIAPREPEPTSVHP